MAFADSDIDSVMAKYKGVGRQELVDCAGEIQKDIKSPDVSDEQILERSARYIMAKRARGSKAQQAEKPPAKPPARQSGNAPAKTVPAMREKEPVQDVVGDIVPSRPVPAADYVSQMGVINPGTDFYLNKQTKRKTLNKRGLDKVSVAAQISTEVRDIISQDDRMIVVVRGWIGPRGAPVVEAEDACDYVYDDKHNDFVFTKIEKKELTSNDLELGEDGKLWFKKGVKDAEIRNIQLRKAVLKEKDFAFRVTVSKARERVIRTLSGMCDMSDKEAEMLKREWARVQGVRN